MSLPRTHCWPVLLVFLTILAPFPSPQILWGQDATVELTDEEARLAEKDLRAVLASPRDQAFHQVLTDISLKPGALSNTTFLFDIYDIVVRYDPQRYRAPHAGLYPLTLKINSSTGANAWPFTAAASRGKGGVFSSMIFPAVARPGWR
jgi:hypothetical protein